MARTRRASCSADDFHRAHRRALRSLTPTQRVSASRAFDLSLPACPNPRDCGAHRRIARRAHACRARGRSSSPATPFLRANGFVRLAEFRNDETEAVAPLQTDHRPHALRVLFARALPRRVEQLLQAGRATAARFSGNSTHELGSPRIVDLPRAECSFMTSTLRKITDARVIAGEKEINDEMMT